MSAPSLPRRYVVAGIATLGLIGGGTVVANAASSDASGPGTPSGSTSSTAAKPTPPAPKPHIDGTVVSVSGDTITVKDHDGFTREIQVGSSTKYTLDGKASSLGAVTSGRFVHGDGTVDSNGTSLDATTVAIMTSAPKPPAGGHGPAGRGPGGRGPGGTGPAALPKPPAGGKAPAGKAPASGTAPSGAPSAPKPSSTSTAHGS